MYVLKYLHVGPTFNGPGIHISDNPMFSGGGTEPKPHAPVKPPAKKPKKK
jgi:hypothetical protein